jgi:hypothetical protein
VTGGDDVKVRHLRGDSRASIVVYEHAPPYRGIEVRGRAVLVAPMPTSSATSLSGTSATRRAWPTRTVAMTTPSSGSSPAVYAPGTSPTTSKWRTRARSEWATRGHVSRRAASGQITSREQLTNVCGHPYSLQIRSRYRSPF